MEMDFSLYEDVREIVNNYYKVEKNETMIDGEEIQSNVNEVRGEKSIDNSDEMRR